jgi:cytochrome c-type biogenesis protein CcmH/NrfG
VFQLYVELFPTEANAYDSLGEAYMNRGDTEQAIASYQRSLELNPDNENAVKMLMKLRK